MCNGIVPHCQPRQGLCSHLAQMWAISDFFPTLIIGDRPQWQGLCSHCAHSWVEGVQQPT